MTVFHKHHIIPLHMGGANDRSNLETISIEEHAEKHKLLYERYGYIEDMIAYLSLSKQMSIQDRILHLCRLGGSKGKNNPKKMGKNNSFYGKTHREDTKKIIGEKSRNRNIGRIPWNKGKFGEFHHSEEVKEKIRKQKLDKKRIGFIPWNKGKKGGQVAWNKGMELKKHPSQ